jgi:hypothetical protein
MTRNPRFARRIVVAVLAAGAGMAHADAGPPLLTDDPGTPGDGRWEMNFAWTTERSASARHDEAPLVDLNYGVGERVQLKFEMPWAAETGRGNDGFGNAAVGVKWRFLDQGEGGWQVSTYPQAGFLPPGLHHAASADSGVGYLLPIEVQRDFGGFDAGFEIGRTLAPAHGDDGWIAGVAVGGDVTERVQLLAELHDETVENEGHELAFNVGSRVRLAEHFTLLASIGTDVENTIDARNRWLSYFGLQVDL